MDDERIEDREEDPEADDLRAEERANRRRRSCQCGDDLPGRCPGVDQCPYADHGEDEEE